MSFDFKREEEVQEFITNLGVEYRFGCYSEKKPNVCHLLGDYLEAIKKEYENAAKVYRNNCDEYGFPKSCLKFGNYCLIGKGRERGDPAEALKYFERGCELGDPTACLHAGIMLTHKSAEIKSPRMDIPKGFNYLKNSCDKKVDQACYLLSGMYISGVPKDPTDLNPHVLENNKKINYLIRPNMAEAFKFAMKGCEYGSVFSCANVSMMYKNGDGVEKNEQLSKKYRKIAEDLQNAAQTAKELKYQQGLE